MKYAYAAVAVAAIARAQSIEDIPPCAIPCIEDAAASASTCSTDDIACLCDNIDAIQGEATSCVLAECGADTALNEVLPAVEALCANPPTDGGDEETTSEESTPEPTPEPTTTLETSTVLTTTVETTITTTDCEEECAPTTLPPTLPAPTNGTTPTMTPGPIPTGAAAAIGSVGGLAMLALGALAL